MADDWRAIPGHELYEVSSAGDVRRLGSTRVLKAAYTHGYSHVSLGRDATTKRIHRLVMLAFVGPCPVGHEVNHKDGNRAHAALDNLEYVTHTENYRDALRRQGGPWGSAATTAARHRAKTQCPRGHPYDAVNTYRYTDNRRGCRICIRTRRRPTKARR